MGLLAGDVLASGLVVALAAASSPPALSDSSESNSDSRPESLRSRVFGTSVQVRYRLSFRVASFSRLWPVGPPSSRLVTMPSAMTLPGSAGPRPLGPLAKLDNVSSASRQYPYSSHAKHRMSAAPAVSAHNDAQAFSRAEGVSPPPQ